MRPEEDVLLDLREAPPLRGFHTAAAAALLASERQGLRFRVLLSENGDERLALAALRHELKQPLPLWRPDPFASRFRLYLLVAEAWPDDSITAAAVQSAQRCLFGQLMSQTTSPPGLLIADGNDTPALAQQASLLLAP